MPNKCVECGTTFEPSAKLWLFCETCDKARIKDMATDLERILSKAQRDPDHAEQVDEIAETRMGLMKDIYGTL